MASRFITAGLLLAAVALCFGCEPRDPSHGGADGDERRIVSLAPGLTQMLVDLGLGDEIVGVAEHDSAAPPGLPVVGTHTDVHTERLLELQPTHVLTLTTARQPPQHLRDLSDRGRFALVAYPFPFTIDAMLDTLHAPDAGRVDDAPPRLGELFDRADRAAALRQEVVDRLDRLRELTTGRAGGDRPDVLMVFGVGPVMASGPGSVHDELLGYVGGRNAARRATVSAPTFDREMLVEIQPDVVLLLMPGAAPLREDDTRLAELRDLPLPAVRDDRVYLLNDPLVLLASTSLPRIAEQMAAAIHPDLAETIRDDPADASQEARPSGSARTTSTARPLDHPTARARP